MLAAVDALLHDLLSAGGIPISFGNLQTPNPGKWKLTDTSGAIINRMFWNDLCVDGASYKVVAIVGSVKKYELLAPKMPEEQVPPGVHPARALQMNSEDPDLSGLADVMSFVDNYLQKPVPSGPSSATNTNAIPVNSGSKKPYVDQLSAWDYPMANSATRTFPSWPTQRSDLRYEPIVRDLNPSHEVQQRPRADSFYGLSNRREENVESPNRDARVEYNRAHVGAWSPTRDPRIECNRGLLSGAAPEGMKTRVIVRNEQFRVIRTVEISLDGTVHQLMSEHLHLKIGSRIQHVLQTKEGWRRCLSYMVRINTAFS